MPLIRSSSKDALRANIRTLMHEVGESPHVQSQKQAVAIAYAVGRRAKKARGGGVSGFLNSPVPGRTDQLPITVGGGAYVLPADHLAAVGQGNSLAGADYVNKMFKMGPYGMAIGNVRPSRRMRKKFAAGGGIGKPTPIIAAGGEMIIPPEKIMEHYGDLDKGHKELDRWVVSTRQQHIRTLGSLKPPKKD